MAWSYRADRRDEVYTANVGPTAVEGEQIVKPPGDAQAPEPPEDQEKRLKEAREAPTWDKNENLPGVTRADMEVLRRQRMDPEAGHEVMNPEQRAKAESELIVKTQDLETQRLAGIERARMVTEERTKLDEADREKEREEVRKQAVEDAKKQREEDKKQQPKAQPRPGTM